MNNKPYLLVSRCLLGEACRYDGKSVSCPAVVQLEKYATLIAVCPESDGGMPTPRIPSEQIGEQVINQKGEDVTAFFRRGAEIAVEKALELKIPFAILKERSPSCGTHQIYDGSFSGQKIGGRGVAAKMLADAGVVLYSEEEITEQLPSALARYLGIEK